MLPDFMTKTSIRRHRKDSGNKVNQKQTFVKQDALNGEVGWGMHASHMPQYPAGYPGVLRGTPGYTPLLGSPWSLLGLSWALLGLSWALLGFPGAGLSLGSHGLSWELFHNYLPRKSMGTRKSLLHNIFEDVCRGGQCVAVCKWVSTSHHLRPWNRDEPARQFKAPTHAPAQPSGGAGEGGAPSSDPISLYFALSVVPPDVNYTVPPG
jgi:hypothetical protein